MKRVLKCIFLHIARHPVSLPKYVHHPLFVKHFNSLLLWYNAFHCILAHALLVCGAQHFPIYYLIYIYNEKPLPSHAVRLDNRETRVLGRDARLTSSLSFATNFKHSLSFISSAQNIEQVQSQQLVTFSDDQVVVLFACTFLSL